MSEIVAFAFPEDSEYNTSKKRLNFIKKFNVKPIKRAHKKGRWIRYRIKKKKYNPDDKHFTKVINDVLVLFES